MPTITAASSKIGRDSPGPPFIRGNSHTQSRTLKDQLEAEMADRERRSADDRIVSTTAFLFDSRTRPDPSALVRNS
jgi:hypothetical protein